MTRFALLVLWCAVGAGRLAAQVPDSLLASIQRLESAGRWREAIAPLERYVALRPDDAARLRQLGQYLSWQGDRERGTPLLRRAAALEPGNAEGLAVLGEVLSWDPDQRAEAGDLFRRALAIEPGNARARVGQANLLAWGGRAGRALPLYDTLLAADPKSLGALRGKGGALNQLLRFEEAEQVLQQAYELDPADPGTNQELAAAALGLERFDDADRRLAAVTAVSTPELYYLQDSVRRARGTWLEVNGLGRDRSNQLDALRGEARFSPYLGHGWRLLAGGQATRFQDSIGEFQSQAAAAGLRYQRSRAFDLSLGGGLRWTDGRSGTDWAASLGMGWRPVPTVRLSVMAERSLVDETRTSVLAGVHSNLAAVGVEVQLLDRRIELAGRGGAGVYTGDGLEDNQRLGGDLSAGWVIRTYRPYLRVGYAFMGSTFEENLAETGGYFSPDRYFANYGTITVSNRFGSRVFWEFDGRLGNQMTAQESAQPNDWRASAVVNTHVTWRVGRATDLDLRYMYVDAFSAFRLHEGRLLLRQYF
ncbi:MAG TPA: tetratricopeptide repeat protein [Gemmatimonadales bacterium]